MGADFIARMNEGANCSEHEVTLTIHGEMEEVRSQLVFAMEKMGYTVLEEKPLYGKREARNGALTLTSVDVLDYPSRLYIGLRPAKEGGTLAVFSYQINHPMLMRNDKKTLSREAEAICALANSSDQKSLCNKCGTEIVADSRFCRRCGVSLSTNEPPEVELLKITSKSTVAYEFFRMSAIFVTISLILILLTFLPTLSLKTALVLKVISILFGSSIIFSYKGLKELSTAIHTNEKKNFFPAKGNTQNLSQVQSLSSYKTGELYKTDQLVLPPPSITENTTDLLPPNPSVTSIVPDRDRY